MRDTALGKRRSTLAEAPIAPADLDEAMIEREPITVIVSKKGWIRALKGHLADLAAVQFKGDDGLSLSVQTYTTAKLLLFASSGKVFTLDASRLPGGRGFGDPVRLMIDFEEGADIVHLRPHAPSARLLLVSAAGRGFLVLSDELIANTRKGRGVFGLDEGDRLLVVAPADGDHVAVIGSRRDLLVFPITELPDLARGKGVRLQRYKVGGVAEAKVFRLQDGLTWVDSTGKLRTVSRADLATWTGHRAEAGKPPPRGFPKLGFGG